MSHHFFFRFISRRSNSDIDNSPAGTFAVPSVEMVDDHGRVIEEKIYKAGSTIELKCVVSKVPGPTANVLWRHGARLLNYDTSRGGIRYHM